MSSNASKFSGVWVAIVTPMRDGGVDEERLRALVDWHVESGTDGLVPCGTTGESATLDHDEHRKVVEVVIDQAAGRVPVLAGTGSNATAESVALTEHARGAGADGALVITPYYNKPSPEGLYLHFREVARVGLPIIAYNVPGRTGIDMKPDTVARIAELPEVVGIKEATGDMDRAQQIIERCGDDFQVLSGDDMTCFAMWAVGGHGVISVSANLAPALMARCWDLYAEGRIAEAREIHYRLLPVHRIMFIESNPVPCKAAMAMIDRCGEEVRLPLAQLQPESREKIRAVVERAGLL